MTLRSVGLCLALVSIASAQQAGDANRNYAINTNTALGLITATCSQTVAYDSVATPGTMTNLYTTADANAPISWIASPNFSLPGLVFGPNEVNIGTQPFFADITVLADGNQPGFLNSVFRTDNLVAASHSMSLSVPTNITMTGQVINFCMLHFAPSSPVGVWISQVHNVGFGVPNAPPQITPPGTIDPFLAAGAAAPNPLATALVGPGDDTSTLQALGFTFKFYSVNYTQLYAGSNGYLTSGSFTTLGETASGLLTGVAKIAAYWDDFNFNATGAAGNASLRFWTDNAGTCEFSWVSLPEYSTTWSATNQNNFKITLVQGAGSGSITMDYGLMASQDGLTGLAPGTVVPAYAGQPVNLTAGVPAATNPICAGRAPYQLFTAGVGTANDLSNLRITWLLDANGVPIAWF